MTLEIGRGGTEAWWLTRESGELPVCEDPWACTACVRASGMPRTPVAYAVLKAGSLGRGRDGSWCGSSLFAPLSVRSVLSLGRAAFWVRKHALQGHGPGEAVCFVIEAFAKGIGCGGAQCVCRCFEYRLCACCDLLRRARVDTGFCRRRFFFGEGVPHSVVFRGVSDAVGDVEVEGGAGALPWLSCPGSVRRVRVDGSMWSRERHWRRPARRVGSGQR